MKFGRVISGLWLLFFTLLAFVVEASSGDLGFFPVASEEKGPGCVIPPPPNRSIIRAKLLEVNKTEPLRVIARVLVLKSEDVKEYTNLTKAGQEINVSFVFYAKGEGKELDTDNPVNKERLTVLGLREGEVFTMEVSLSAPSIWFCHKAWKEPPGEEK